MHRLLVIMLLALSGLTMAQEHQVKIKLVETSDVHGAFFPYDFISRKEVKGSLASLSTYLNRERAVYGDNLILMDNGDLLQGQPSIYYYNYIDTLSTHLAARVTNYLKYDLCNVGNHDVEAGVKVLKRLRQQCQFPLLGANIINTATGQPAFPPYVVFEREGVKIAVLGLITPAIPSWLPEELWRGWRFDDLEQTARRWVKEIQTKEKPHVIVGIFHSGLEETSADNEVVENASRAVANRVAGFDVIFCGHDHMPHLEKVTNRYGQPVWLVNPGSSARKVGVVEMDFTLAYNKIRNKQLSVNLASLENLEPDSSYLATFQSAVDTVNAYVNRPIGTITKTISSRDAYFGNSSFVDFVHHIQLAISGADVSLSAPLSFNVEIKEGQLCVSDLFNLYKFENKLYTMRLTGKEIKKALEMSYAKWTNHMKGPDDHLLLIEKSAKGSDTYFFTNPSFNFDSAAGINYTVDVTRPHGEKLTITSMADGSPFDPEKVYLVAVNSYRGNGGGDLLTKGAGISKAKLDERIVSVTDLDLRYYVMKYIEAHPNLEPVRLNNWHFVPEEWVKPAAERDYKLLFGGGNSSDFW